MAATISGLLNTIRTESLGKNIRTALADSIEAINNDTFKIIKVNYDNGSKNVKDQRLVWAYVDAGIITATQAESITKAARPSN